ncbi:MAG: hypothetical protein ACR2QO_26580, partial [Acidimicrobiales bacterium]
TLSDSAAGSVSVSSSSWITIPCWFRVREDGNRSRWKAQKFPTEPKKLRSADIAPHLQRFDLVFLLIPT